MGVYVQLAVATNATMDISLSAKSYRDGESQRKLTARLWASWFVLPCRTSLLRVTNNDIMIITLVPTEISRGPERFCSDVISTASSIQFFFPISWRNTLGNMNLIQNVMGLDSYGKSHIGSVVSPGMVDTVVSASLILWSNEWHCEYSLVVAIEQQQ